MIIGKNKSLNEQLVILSKILNKSPTINKILNILENYSHENSSFNNYFLAAGCINQTVFNYYHNYKLDYGIKDYDIVYYDEDTSYSKEDTIIKDLKERLNKLNIEVDIKNQKRVPIWYNKKYHTNRKEYTSVEDAIRRWATTITSIGVRKENKELIVFAPYGLNDLFSLTIRPVKIDCTKEQYYKKVNKWQKKWPKLEIIEYDE